MKHLVVSVLACCVVAAVFAADGVWQGGNGEWDDGAHWVEGVLAGGGGVAVFIGAGAVVSNKAVVTLSGMMADVGALSGPNVIWTIRDGVFELDAPALFETRLVQDARDPGNHRLDLTETLLRSAEDVTVTGAGRLALGTTNELTGRIVVSNGNLYAVSDGGYGTAPASYQADAIILDGGALGNGAASPFLTLHPNRGITLLGGGGFINVGNFNSSLVLSSPITGAGALNINMEASPAVLDNSGNDYTGGTFVGTRGIGGNAGYDGALKLGRDNVIPDIGGLVVSPLSSYQTGERGSRLDMNGFTDSVDTLASGPKATIMSSVPGQGRLTVGGAGGDSDLRGTVSGGVTIAQDGAGTLSAIGANVRDATLDLLGGTLAAGGVNFSADATVRFGGGGMTLVAPSGLSEFTGTNAPAAIDLDAPLAYAGWRLWPEYGGTASLATYRQAVYRGRWKIPAGGVTYSFGKAFDDGAYLRIGETVILSDTNASPIICTNGITLAEGWHDIELRFANYGGGSGVRSNFLNGVLYDPQNGDFTDPAVRARGKMFTDDGGPNLRAIGAPTELSARLLLATNATLTVTADAEPFTLGGNITTEPGATPADPVLTIATTSAAPLLFGSSGAYPAVLDATVAAPNGITLTNKVWLRRAPQQPWDIAVGADIALDGAALLGAGPLALTDHSARVVHGDSIGGDGSVTVSTGATVWFDTMRYAENRLTNSAAAQTYANAVTLINGGTAAFTGAGDITYTGAITGTGTVRVEGPGAVRLTSTATSLAGSEIVLAGGTLRPDSEATLGGAPLRFAGGRLANPAGSDLTLGTTPISGIPGGFEVDAGRALTLSGAVTAAELSKWGAGLLTLGGAASNDGLILHVREGAAELAKTGAAFAVSDLNLYGATARITGDSGNQINRNLTLSGGAVLDVNGHDEGVGAITGTGTITNGGGRAVTLTFGEGNATGDLTNVTLAGGYSLAKVGTGAFVMPFDTLAAVSAAHVDGGTLRVDAHKLPFEGLAYRLDASDPANVTVEDGLVTAWKDVSGNGVTLITPSPAKSPQYAANGLNGRPAVYFPDGQRTRLYTDTAVDCRTVFIVCQRTDNNNLAGLWGQNGNDKGLRANSATTWRFTGTGGDGNDFAFNGEMYINGVATSTFAVGDLQVLTAVSPNTVRWATAIGDYWNNDGVNGVTRFFNGYVSEILVYSTKLSDAARQEIEAYLTDKWLGDALGKVLDTPLAIAAGATAAFESQPLAIATLTGAGALAFGGGSDVKLLDYSGFNGTVSGAGAVFSLRAGDARIRPQGLGTIIRNDGAAGAVLRVDTTGNNTFIGGIYDGASTLGITQTGDGVTCYAGTNSAYTGATRIEGGTAQIGAVTAQYIRFWPTLTRTSGDRTNSGYQLSEFRLRLAGAEIAWPAGTRATCAEKPSGTEGPDSALDGLTSTKFYVNFNAPYSPLVIHAPEAMAFNGYSWYTANDSSGRDAVGWHVDISEDGETWTTIDTRDYSQNQEQVTTARNVLVGAWDIMTATVTDIFSDVSLTTIAAPGTLALKGASETVGALSGDGAVTLEGGATFGINAFEDAAFAGGISGDGTVIKSGAATQTLSGALAFSGTIIVRAGTLDLTGATLTGVTNIIIMAGAELTGVADVNGDLTVTFEDGGRYSGTLVVIGALTVEGPVTLAVPSGAAYPYKGALFTYASADAATQGALQNAIRPQTPPNMGATIRVTDTEAMLTIAPTGTLLLLL